MKLILLAGGVLLCLFPFALTTRWLRWREYAPARAYFVLGMILGLATVLAVILGTTGNPDFVYVNF